MPASPARVATLVALPVAVLAGIGLFSVLASSANGPSPTPSASASGASAERAPVAVTAPPAIGADQVRLCGRAIGALPIVLEGQRSRAVTAAPERVVAWGEPPVVLRCGVPPVKYPPDANLTTINGVAWYGRPAGKTIVFTTVDRTIPVEVTVPTTGDGNPSDPLVTLATPIGKVIPASASGTPSPTTSPR